MELRTLGQTVVDVLEAIDWFKAIGIDTAGTRLEQINSYLQELLNPTTPSANPFQEEPNGPGASQAAVEAVWFGRVTRQLRALPSHRLPRRALRDVLAGPFMASDESAESSDARNKFVELELAAMCMEAGIEVTGFDDVRFSFENTSYLVECKRPLSSAALRSNVSKGYQQLCRKMGESDRGIVAVAVDRVFGLDGRFFDVTERDQLLEIATSYARQLEDAARPELRTWVDSRVVGVAAIVRFLMRGPSQRIGSSYQFAILKVASGSAGQLTDSMRLDRIAACLKRGAIDDA